MKKLPPIALQVALESWQTPWLLSPRLHQPQLVVLMQVLQSVASKQLLTIGGAQLSGFHRPPTVEQRFELTCGKQVPIAPGISQ